MMYDWPTTDVHIVNSNDFDSIDQIVQRKFWRLESLVRAMGEDLSPSFGDDGVYIQSVAFFLPVSLRQVQNLPKRTSW
jgi:hypothetical protein